MPNNKRALMVRVTKDQHKRARNLADAHGFASISQLVRSVLFERDLLRENKIDKIYEAVCGKYTPSRRRVRRNLAAKRDPLYDVEEGQQDEPYQAELYMK